MNAENRDRPSKQKVPNVPKIILTILAEPKQSVPVITKRVLECGSQNHGVKSR